MEIFRRIAGYTFGHADIVRRAMSKKHADELEAERENFVKGATENGVSREGAEKLFESMADFARYAFNKSHAAAYAVVAYRIAYLKCRYPREYMAALLGSVLGSMGKVAEYIAECGKMSIRVLPPDINHSNVHFHVDGEDIRFGLLALKNVGKQFAAQIVAERRREPFTSFENFVERMKHADLNKRQVETLIKAGAFDSLGVYRSRLLASYETIIDTANDAGRGNIEGQLDMFSTAPVGVLQSKAFEYPDIPEFSPRELLMLEKECSGLYFTGHLLDGYSAHIASLPVVSLADLTDEEREDEFPDKMRISAAGMISSVSVKNTRSGDRMAFFELEDKFGKIECVAFSKQYARMSHLIHIDCAVSVTGTVSRREDEVKLLVNDMEELIENAKFLPKEPPKPVVEKPSAEGKLYLRVPDFSGAPFKKAINLIDLFEGGTQVVFYDCEKKTYSAYGKRFLVSAFTLSELKSLLGEENVVYH